MMPVMAGAASVWPDFDFTVVDGSALTANATAGSATGDCDPFDGNGCDASIETSFGAVSVYRLDGDSFDIGFCEDDVSFLSVSLDGLNFTEGARIADVSCNLSGGSLANLFNVVGFQASPSNPTESSEPSIFVDFLNAAGGSRIDIDIAGIGPLLGVDAPTLCFDVLLSSSKPPTTTPVPLPAGGFLLLCGYGVLGLARCRS